MHKRKFVDKATDEGQKKKMRDAEKEQIFASCSFTSLGLHPTLCEQLKERLSFEVPTLIQSQAIPVALSGRHVLVNAATGTGKTIAYLAPIIHHLQSYEPRIQRSDGTFALILVPTHELCMQIYEILQKLVHRFHWIVPGYIMGGENRLKEKARLRKGISVLVATPGRLLDHLMNTTSFQHSKLRWLIFDEADRILELGFGKEIEDILDILGTRKNESNNKDSAASCGSTLQRQNLLLSATLNDKVNHLAKISLENPVMVGLDNMALQNPTHTKFTSCGTESEEEEEEHSQKVISSNEGYTFPAQLVQRYVKVPCGSRLTILLLILKNLFEKEVSQKAVVFFSTCNAVDFHYSLLSEFCWSSNSQPELEQKNLFLKCKIFRLHGDMMHEDRRKAFQAFKTEKSALLLSTDVSARGLDIPKVRCILQYDSPGEATEYVHRVGRTARLGEKGESLLFLQPLETDYLQDLEKHGVSLTEYPILKLLNSSPMLGHKPNVKKFISIDMHPLVVSLQMALESFTANKPDIKELAIAAFCSWVRAYTAHRGELKKIFMVKKLHLGHVARSFGLKEQPSFVGALKKRNDLIKEQRYQRQIVREIEKKKKRDQKQIGTLKKRKRFIKS